MLPRNTFFSKEKGTKQEIVFDDIMISSYCEAFTVLSSQRVQAAVVGVG